MYNLVRFWYNDRALDSHELDYTVPSRAEALLRARDRVGFANKVESDEDAPIEATVSFEDVPLATINDYSDTLLLRGLDNMTVVNYYWDAMKEVRYGLMAAVEDDQNLMKAIGECSLGQLFLILQGIKANIDNRNRKE